MSETKTPLFRWKLHGNGTSINPGDVVLPGERLSWPRTAGIGAQHVVAMFGATFLVPLLTGFPPSTTLFFTAIGTLLFFLITAGRLPSYLGSSFALIAPITAVVTIVSICLVTVLFKGILGRLSILIGVLIGYVAAIIQGQVDFSTVSKAAWIGFPEFQAPSFAPSTLGLFLPVVFILVAENVGHVKSVSAMTGENMDDLTGRALVADGLSTMLAGSGGGSGTTTYAENIGVMAATRVYSTAAYLIAAGVALVLSMLPKFGALIATIPPGVLGGAGTVLYGMIGMLGVRIWVQNRVDFSNPVNLNTAAVALIVAIANFTWKIGDMSFEGIALGTASALLIYHGMRLISKLRGTNLEAATPASAPSGSELEGEAYSKRHRSPAPQADA